MHFSQDKFDVSSQESPAFTFCFFFITTFFVVIFLLVSKEKEKFGAQLEGEGETLALAQAGRPDADKNAAIE